MPKQNAAPLKIGIVLDTSLDPPDGVQQYVLSIGPWLAAQGHDVHYIVGESHRTDVKNMHSLAKNFSVRFNGNRTTIPLPTSRRKLRAFLAQEQFDVLHVQTPHNPFFAHRLILAADKTTPVVATFHVLPDGWLPWVGTYALGLWLRRSLKRIDQMCSVSSAAAEFACKTFKKDSMVLPNVFDYRRFHDALPIKADPERKTILFLGRLVPRKGCKHLLEAVALLDRSTLPPFHVVICGKGPLMDELRQLTAAKHLDDIVEFAGFVSEEDKPGYYASADISVFPSTGGESFGIVLLEAMAAGQAAVLAGNNPGYATVMEPQPTLLFNPHDTQALASQLEQYLRDDESRHDMAAWGADYTHEFDIEVVGPKLESLYRQLYAAKNMQ